MRSQRFDVMAKIPDGVSKDRLPEMPARASPTTRAAVSTKSRTGLAYQSRAGTLDIVPGNGFAAVLCYSLPCRRFQSEASCQTAPTHQPISRLSWPTGRPSTGRPSTCATPSPNA